MKTNNEFQKAGKKMPYTVPDGFFDRITEKTLAEAKLRQKTGRKRIILWSSLATAATLAALVTVGILVFPLSHEKEDKQSVQNTLIIPDGNSIDQKAIIPGKPENRNIPTPGEKIAGKTIPDNTGEENNLEEFLAALSDEELLQLAARLTSDTFIDESNNN
jgi:hypothetical protein